jgi:Secretion system C-terminal sorting domain
MKQFIIFAAAILLVSNTLFANNIDPTPTYDNYHLGSSKKGIIIMPNKATGDAQVLFVTSKPAAATIKVYDANGTIVLQQEAQLTEGKNKVNIDKFTNLAEGNYTIKLISNNKQYTASFLMWK